MSIPNQATLNQAKKYLADFIRAETGEDVKPAPRGQREYTDDFSAKEKAWAVFAYQASDMVAGTPAHAQAKVLKAFFELKPIKEFLEVEPIWGGGVLEHLIGRVNADNQPAVFKRFAETAMAFSSSIHEVQGMALDVFTKIDPSARPAAFDAVMRSHAFQQAKSENTKADVLEFKAKLAALLPATDMRLIGQTRLALEIDPDIIGNMPLPSNLENDKLVTAVCLGTKRKPEIHLVGETTIQSFYDVRRAWKERAHQIEIGNDAEDSHDVSGFACGRRFGQSYVVSCARLSNLFAGAAEKLKDVQPRAAKRLSEMAAEQPFSRVRYGREWVY
jgi:hypothetical protein